MLHTFIVLLSHTSLVWCIPYPIDATHICCFIVTGAQSTEQGDKQPQQQGQKQQQPKQQQQQHQKQQTQHKQQVEAAGGLMQVLVAADSYVKLYGEMLKPELTIQALNGKLRVNSEIR
jgi:hypothetical protein